MMTLFSQERLDQFKYNEALAEGIGIGREEGREDIISKLVMNGVITPETAARTLGIPTEEFEKKYSSWQPIQG